MKDEDSTADAIACAFNADGQNVVDVMEKIVDAGRDIANAITPLTAGAGQDAMGGHVESLTEAVMGMTAALNNIADAIRESR